jgi:hypothetical protein
MCKCANVQMEKSLKKAHMYKCATPLKLMEEFEAGLKNMHITFTYSPKEKVV